MRKIPEIDFAILWVDGQDEEWRKTKDLHLEKYRKEYPGAERFKNSQGNGAARFNDFDTLKYLVRSIEKYAPWFNRIFLITNGQRPKWLNADSKRIVLKTHEEFFRNKSDLPTFNCNAIHVNLNNIEELTEKFILCDDDIFMIRPMRKEDFFKKGLPVKYPALSIIKNKCDLWECQKINNLELFNSAGMRLLSRKNFFKVFFSDILLLLYNLNKLIKAKILKKGTLSYVGSAHLLMPYLRSFNKYIEQSFAEAFTRTSANKFRREDGVICWFWDQWYIASGAFSSRMLLGKTINITNDKSSIDNNIIERTLRNPFYRFMCLQDSTTDLLTEKEFLELKGILEKKLDKIFPEKSSFEK